MRKKYRKKVLCLRPSVEFISFRFFFFLRLPLFVLSVLVVNTFLFYVILFSNFPRIKLLLQLSCSCFSSCCCAGRFGMAQQCAV